jgi:hypothetical protein
MKENDKVKFKIYGRIETGVITTCDEESDYVSINDGWHRMSMTEFKKIIISR